MSRKIYCDIFIVPTIVLFGIYSHKNILKLSFETRLS